MTSRTSPSTPSHLPVRIPTYDHSRQQADRPVLESTLLRRNLNQRLSLVSGTTAPRQARDFLAAACAEWATPGFLEIGGLVLSELVSNAVLHATGSIEVALRLAGGRLTIEVGDSGQGVPAVVPAARRGVGGNGLDIVSRLAETWGVTANPGGGKTVWCVIAPEA